MSIYARAGLLSALAYCCLQAQDVKHLPRRISSDALAQGLASPCGAMPPELAADCLLRIAVKASSGNVAERIRLIEEALVLAPRATDSTMVRAQAGASVDSLEGFHQRATALKMTSAGLLARSLDMLLSLDAQRAVGLAAYMRVPELRADGDALEAPDVSELFSTFERVGAAMKPRERVEFLDRQVRSVTSPVEVGPAAALIGNAELGVPDLQYLASVSLLAGLQNCERDDRGFQYTQFNTRQAFGSLLVKCRDAGIATTALAAGFEDYYSHQVTAAETCSSASLASALNDLNRLDDLVFPKAERARRKDLNCDAAAKPTQPDQQERIFQSGASRDLLHVMQRLHRVPNDSPEFAKKFDEALRAVVSWSRSTDSSRVFVHEKAEFYAGLMRMAPDLYSPRRASIGIPR